MAKLDDAKKLIELADTSYREQEHECCSRCWWFGGTVNCDLRRGDPVSPHGLCDNFVPFDDVCPDDKDVA